jgi:hypothetical protein
VSLDQGWSSLRLDFQRGLRTAAGRSLPAGTCRGSAREPRQPRLGLLAEGSALCAECPCNRRCRSGPLDGRRRGGGRRWKPLVYGVSGALAGRAALPSGGSFGMRVLQSGAKWVSVAPLSWSIGPERRGSSHLTSPARSESEGSGAPARETDTEPHFVFSRSVRTQPRFKGSPHGAFQVPCGTF